MSVADPLAPGSTGPARSCATTARPVRPLTLASSNAISPAETVRRRNPPAAAVTALNLPPCMRVRTRSPESPWRRRQTGCAPARAVPQVPTQAPAAPPMPAAACLASPAGDAPRDAGALAAYGHETGPLDAWRESAARPCTTSLLAAFSCRGRWVCGIQPTPISRTTVTPAPTATVITMWNRALRLIRRSLAPKRSDAPNSSEATGTSSSGARRAPSRSGSGRRQPIADGGFPVAAGARAACVRVVMHL